MNSIHSGTKQRLSKIAACIAFVLAGCFHHEAHTNLSSIENTETFQYEDIPPYEDMPYVTVNDNEPFKVSDLDESSISLNELDELGRCQDVEAVIGMDTLPTESRGSIGDIRPSGWHTVRYDDLIESKYLYNRCHLIAFEISGINDDPRNLITGTRYLNMEGMLPFENKVVSYIKKTGNHVYYHATPIFIGG